MNKEFWENHYKKYKQTEPSSFAQFIVDDVKGSLVDIGCGDGRDLYYFKRKGIQAHGVDESNEDLFIIRQNILDYIKEQPSPDNVYARFFWHAIDRTEQLAILDWTKKYLFIEARTTEDKPKNVIGRHRRKLVDTKRLRKDLLDRGFIIKYFYEGTGLSPYRGEDPHLVRIIAEKQ